MESSIGDYVIGRTIGEGTFGKVRLGTHRATQETVQFYILNTYQVAIKILEKEKIVSTADVERVRREIHIL